MSIQVVRIESYNKGSLGTIGRECDRGKGINHRNQEIDAERSRLNISYKDATKGFVAEYADIIMSLNAQGKETKKGVAFEGMIITADLPFFEHLGYEQGRPLSKDVKTFFDRCYEFAKVQIGYQGTDKNILSAKIHLDEKTPHLHLYYVPITEKWQTKVYAKGEDGKVLRSERGTPIQARDIFGKILYEQHEDVTAPKLSRTEFWRVRGGQFSYRLMQDRFQEMVGKEYGLERGEVGSDRQHRTKYQWEYGELQVKKEKLEAEIEPLKELKTDVSEIDTVGKKLPFGIVAVKEEEFQIVKEQAKAYTVNRDEISTLRMRSDVISQKEKVVEDKEQQLVDKEQQLVRRQYKLQQMYQRQLNLNQILQELERDVVRKEEEISRLRSENHSLRLEKENLRNTLGKRIEVLRTMLRGAYESLTNVVKAVSMLKYDQKEGYKIIGITQKQSRLIDSLSEYGAKWAKTDGFPDLAEVMEKYIGISKGIADIMQPLEKNHFQQGIEPEL